ncbi:MAG: WD40 repeat domain-containing protein [Rhodospirillales bacterium]
MADPKLTAWELGAPVSALAFAGDGALALALGDGNVALSAPGASDAPRKIQAHDGAALCLSADGGDGAFLSGGDDGKLMRVGADGALAPIAAWQGKWVEHVLAPANGGFRAAAVGKTVHLFDRAGKTLEPLQHESTVSGIAANPKAKRLAASHYNGVSLWWTHGGRQSAKVLRWAGSHIGVTWSPDGEYVVSALQDMELHGWRIDDNSDMRMSGYPAKVRSLAWSRQPYFLATAGADRIVCWPFAGAGPMGKPPVELGYARSAAVSAVAAHPRGDLIAAGYGDGTVALAKLSTQEAAFAKPPGGGRIEALAFSPDGRRVAFGTEEGLAGAVEGA